MRPTVRLSWGGLGAVLALLSLLVLVPPGLAAPPAPGEGDAPKKVEPDQPNGVPPLTLPDLETMLRTAPPGYDPATLIRYREALKRANDGLRAVRADVQRAPAQNLVPLPPPALLPDTPVWAPPASVPEATRLGVRFTRPSETLADQLELPKDQGLVIEVVHPNSPAAKAGLKAHDILLEFDGKPISSDVREFSKALQAVKADTTVAVLVLRRGRREAVKGLTLPEAKAATPGELPSGNRPPPPPPLPPG